MAEKDCELCMFPDLRDKSNDSSVVDRLSMVTSGRIGPLPYSKDETFKTIDLSLTEWLLDTPSLVRMSNKSIFHD